MACGSGCCGPPGDPGEAKTEVQTDVKAEEETAMSDAVRIVVDDRADGIVKTGTDGIETVAACCAPAKTTKNCEADCCSPKTKPVQEVKDEEASQDCLDACCSQPAVKVDKSTVKIDNAGIESAADCCLGEVRNDCETDCCSPSTKPLQEDNGEEDTKGCQDACCSLPATKDTKVVEDSQCLDACCSKPAAKADRDSKDGKDNRPNCCQGKTTPCCDESCLDRIALRDCSDVDDSEDGKPCSEHRRKTRSLYAARLAAFGCICRALVALGQESCCVAGKGKGKARGKFKPAKKRPSMDSCCEGDNCCKPEITNPTQAVQSVRPANKKKKTPKTPVGFHSGHDPEKALDKEHVVLSISGMTCTGCETKLLRTLGTHTAVANLKTSLVLSRAEFDLVGGQGHTIGDVMKHVERTTEFKCENISNKGGYLTLDISMPSSSFSDKSAAAAAALQTWPDGVLEVKVVNKDTVSVTFDPKVIGARDLVNRGWGDGQKLELAPPRPDPALDAGSKHVRHIGYTTIVSALLTIPVLVLAWAPLPDSGRRTTIYSSVSLALATIVQVAIAGPFYSKALKALLFSHVIEMDLLVVLSTTTAYVFSVVSFVYTMVGQPLSTGSFFETSTLLVTLIMLGRWVAALARQKAVESISIRGLQTQCAVITNEKDEDEMIDARLLQYGDVFKVMPDGKVPTDGTVIKGTSDVNEALITGESRPVFKEAKSALIAGSTNGSGELYARVTRLPGENTISSIASMVDEAKLSKPRIQALADRVASYFVPVIVGLTVVTFCVWMAVGIRVRRQSASDAAVQAITYAMTVLIVSCPCAIGLAVPMVVVIASGVAAERGVVFKSAEAIEVMHKVTDVVFDKTGTVTQGQLAVSREWFAEREEGREETKRLLLGLLNGIKHPVSASVVGYLAAQGIEAAAVQDKKALPGLGVEGVVPGKVAGLKLQAGNSRWLDLGSHDTVKSMLHDGLTTFCFLIDGSVAAIFGLSDSLRPEAMATVNTLAQSNIAVHLVSGDDDGAVQAAARHLNIPPANVRSRCSPAEKRDYVQQLVGDNKTTVFVGDGTNDAAAIAQAAVGVHVNSSDADDIAQSAQSAADVVLMRPDLSGLLVACAVSRKAVHRIVFNFCWSFVYNLFAIMLAAGVFEAVRGRNVRIPPEYAGLGELVSVLPVVVAATLLRWAQY